MYLVWLNHLNAVIIFVALKTLVATDKNQNCQIKAARKQLLRRIGAVILWSGGQTFIGPVSPSQLIRTKGEGYKHRRKQPSHKLSCSCIPTQVTDFHTVLQPNIGIIEAYRGPRCPEAHPLIQRIQVCAPQVSISKTHPLHTNCTAVYELDGKEVFPQSRVEEFMQRIVSRWCITNKRFLHLTTVFLFLKWMCMGTHSSAALTLCDRSNRRVQSELQACWRAPVRPTVRVCNKAR